MTDPAAPIALRFQPPIGACWQCRIRTRVEVREPGSGALHVSDGEMLTREEIVRALGGGLVKQIRVLESPQEPDLCQGVYESLCSLDGGQLLAIGQESPFPPSPPLFPSHPVAMGDTWPVEANLNLPMRGSSQALPATLRVRGTGRLSGRADGRVQLEFRTESLLEGPGPASQGQQELKILVDLATGVCLRSETRGREEIRLAPDQEAVVVTTLTRMESAWEKPAGPA